MYYEDLTPYEYGVRKGELNVGWLDKEKSFNKTKATPEFLAALKLYNVDEAVTMRTKGFHVCPFCELKSSGSGIFSSNEIRVFGNGKKYAAPRLIFHYVEEHDYTPPQEFIDAVMNGPKPESEDYSNIFHGRTN